MNKSKLLQIFLLISALVIFGLTYYSSLKKNKLKTIDIVETLDEKKIDKPEDNTSSIISSLSYESVDYGGNVFNIKAEVTKIFIDQKSINLIYSDLKDFLIEDTGVENINFMEVVSATITLRDGRKIEIFSDRAIYNAVSYNTSFINNVKMIENDNVITAQNLDFFFNKKFVTIYNDVKYKGFNKFLSADKVDISLDKKEVEIYMMDKADKITINLKN